MEDIIAIVISIIVLAASLAGFGKKKNTEQKKEAPVPSSFPFSIQEEEKQVKKNSKDLSKTFFDQQKNTPYEKRGEKIKAEKKQEEEKTKKEKFDLKKAIIYTEILNRPYN